MALDCLLINLTRFGDIIQSQALVHDLCNMGLRTGLLCQENFARTGMLIDGLAGVWALPGAKLLRAVDTDWRDAYQHMRVFSKAIQEEKPRFVVNLTPLPAARLLAKLFSPAEEALVGFGIDREGFGFNNGPWSTFLCASSLCRENAVFNVTDLFRNIAAPLGRRVTRNADIRCRKACVADSEHAESILASIERLPGSAINGYVAFQLGASSPVRQWPTEFFAALGDRLWKEAGICPVLTGAKSETPLAEEYAKHSRGPFVMAIGKTDLGALSALLSKVRLLVSNDTGTLHLASALETRSVSFFLATAQPWDTGPALPGCVCLEPDIPCHPCAFKKSCGNDHVCQRTIRPEPVAQAILTWLAGASWTESFTEARITDARIWETGRDENGLSSVREIVNKKAADRTRWNLMQRAFWQGLLDRPGGNADFAAFHPCCFADRIFGETLYNEARQAASILKALEEQTLLLGKSGTAGALFLRNCDRLQTHLLTSRYLQSFGHYWSEIRNVLSRSLPELDKGIRNFRTHLERLAQTLHSGMKDA